MIFQLTKWRAIKFVIAGYVIIGVALGLLAILSPDETSFFLFGFEAAGSFGLVIFAVVYGAGLLLSSYLFSFSNRGARILAWLLFLTSGTLFIACVCFFLFAIGLALVGEL